MVITCPKCGAKYQVKEPSKTARVRCKKCQGIIEVRPGAGAARSEMKTQVPAKQPDAASRAEMKTAVPRQAAPRETAEKTLPMSGDEQPPSGSLIGRTLGGYEVRKKLGEGGMGAVYEARQVALDRSVALKVLPPHLAANTEFIRRFSREALSVAKLNHNNIVQIYDIGKTEGTYFFSMEFVRGTNIGDIIAKEGKMEIGRAAGYILQAARGLEYAHRSKIVHRDIKPDNLMVNEDDVVKVADLGLAKQLGDEEVSMTMSGVGMGTPVYMSPEQGSDAKNADHRADIYSLGCTLYHMITGKIPYEGASAFEIITKHVNEPLRPPSQLNPDISDELSGIVGKMLAKKKEDRYQSMTDVIRAIEDYLGLDYAQAGFVPTEGQIAALQESAGAVAAAAGSGVLKIAGFLIAAVAILVGLAGIFKGSASLVVGAILYALTAWVVYAFLVGTTRKTHLYRRIRKFVFGNKLSDWITLVVALVAAAALIVFLAAAGIAGLVLGLLTALALFFAVKKPLLRKLDGAVGDVKKLAREIRRKGIPDESIDLFVARHGGKYGEVICEELSGYDAVLATRSKRTQEELDKAKRPFYYNFREGLLRWLDNAEKKRDEAKRAALTPVPAEGAAPAAAVAAGAPAPAVSAATEAYIAEVIEEKKPRANPAVAIPKFILGGKGRVTVGAVLLILFILSVKDIAFAESATVGSWSFAMLGAALMFSGFVHSKTMMTLFLLSALASLVTLVKPDIASLGTRILGADAEGPKAQVTIGFLAGLVPFILAFVAGFLFRGGKAKISTEGGAS